MSFPFAGIAFDAIADVEISYGGAQCPQVNNNCGTHGDFQGWLQEDGKLACVCNK